MNDIYNFDETPFLLDRGLAREARKGIKKPKTRLTVALGVNASGTDKLPPLFIGFAKKPRCFPSCPDQLGYDYDCSAKAWMTGDIFRAWIQRLQARMLLDGRHIVLFVDNFSGDKSPPEDTPNVRLEYFSANMRALVQPCDAVNDLLHGVVKPDLFKIDQKSAMDLAIKAWGLIKVDTFINCWNKTNILLSPLLAASSESTEMEALSEAMRMLDTAVSNVSITLDMPTPQEFVDNGEIDEFALASLSIDEICDFVSYVDDDDRNI
ncbi:hypothetical protein LEN26_012771 [Aphanomyces euteiches]|nr:hypothetical protein LEN26_012771 [Aphanomyces euteiches]